MRHKHEVHKYSLKILGSTKVEWRDGKRYLVKTGSGYPVLKCMLPNCSHYVPIDMGVGRKSICWGCGQELVLTPLTVKMKKPVHDECKRRRKVA